MNHQKAEEKTIVVFADTVAQNFAMMVEIQHTPPASLAMEDGPTLPYSAFKLIHPFQLNPTRETKGVLVPKQMLVIVHRHSNLHVFRVFEFFFWKMVETCEARNFFFRSHKVVEYFKFLEN